MQISVTHPTETETKIVVVPTSDELQALKEQVLAKLGRKVRVAGFRSGKVPLSMVEKNLDSNVLQNEFLDAALNQMYTQAITQEKLRPVHNPSVNVTKFVPFATLEFEATVPVLGKVKLADYKKIKKPKTATTVTAEDVSEVLTALQRRMAERKEVKRAAKLGDELLIDFAGTDTKKKPVPGAEGKNYPLTLGANTFIPGFEDNLVGLKSGDEKTFDVTFPKDYNVQTLASQKVTFTVQLHKVHELTLPKADDEFAKKAGPFKSLAGLKSDVKEQLTNERTQQANIAYENDLIRDITAKSSLQLPTVLVDQQLDQMEQEERQNVTYRGQTWQEHLAEEGVTEAEHRDQKRGAAEERVKASFILAEIADAEELEITIEELNARMDLLKSQYSDITMAAELQKPEARRDIAARMLTEKTVERLMTYATAK